jgi:HSP20 family protein
MIKQKKSFSRSDFGTSLEESNEEKIKPEIKEESAEVFPDKDDKDDKDDNWLADSEGQLTVDVYQTPADIVIKSIVGGAKPEDIDVEIANDMITIKGKRENFDEIKTEDYYYQECFWGAFSRSIILPVDVEADKIKATIKDGILKIVLPKAEKNKTKKIRVKTE